MRTRLTSWTVACGLVAVVAALSLGCSRPVQTADSQEQTSPKDDAKEQAKTSSTEKDAQETQVNASSPDPKGKKPEECAGGTEGGTGTESSGQQSTGAESGSSESGPSGSGSSGSGSSASGSAASGSAGSGSAPGQSSAQSTSGGGAGEQGRPELNTPQDPAADHSKSKSAASGDAAPKQHSGSPLDARRKAAAAAKSAQKSAANGDYAKAFREARTGWEAVAPFSKDSGCQTAAKGLLQSMKEYAVKANSTTDKAATGKTLVLE